MLDEIAQTFVLRSIRSLLNLCLLNACRTISGRARGRNSGGVKRGQTGRLALLRFPAQRSPRLPDFEAGRKNVRVAPLVLLRAGVRRAGQNCAVDRAV